MALPGTPMAAGAAPQPGAAPAPQQAPGERVVSEQDTKLAADYLKRIEAAKERPAVKDSIVTFKRNRKLLRGIDPDTGKKMRTNLFFANLAAMRPQVYAKDPEYSVKPNAGIDGPQLDLMKKFASTCESVLNAELVKGCKLKKRAKRLLTATYTTAVGWWKMGFQEDKRSDPLIVNQIKDTQDELMRLQSMRDKLDDPQSCADTDLQLAKIQQTLAGLESKSEIVVGRGLLLDFVLSEDMLILDASVRELADYTRASAMAHRIWLTRAAFRTRFGFDPKGKVYADISGGAAPTTPSTSSRSDDDLFEVFEIWDQDSSRVVHVSTGEKGFLDAPISPDWTGERWYPFFALLFNETDGDMFPLSDVELIEGLVKEYNEARDDLVADRRDTRPFTVIRKGGSLTQKDADNIRNRKGNDIVLVEGVGQNPLSADIQPITLGKIDPQNYNTQPARSDIEQIIGGGDAARGTVMNAKTATEAEILNQGLRGRSAERQDTVEDLLTEVGIYALQICLRKLTRKEVSDIVGGDASEWPEATSVEEIFRKVTLDVRGGSTGKPDRLQDQDRWTKLLPVIEKTIEQVSELRQKGQAELAQALIELTRETLRRFDERLDIETFLPPAKSGDAPDPQALAQQVQELKQHLEEQQKLLDEAQDGQQEMVFKAATAIATCANPAIAVPAFQQALEIVRKDAAMADQVQQGEAPQPGQQMPPAGLAPDLQAAIAAQQQPAGPPGAPPVPQADPTQSGPVQPQPQ